MDSMTDIVVRIDVENRSGETKLIEAVDKFALKQSRELGDLPDAGDAPAIMIKTVPDGRLTHKRVIFQDKQSAEEFLYFWRRFRKSS